MSIPYIFTSMSGYISTIRKAKNEVHRNSYFPPRAITIIILDAFGKGLSD